MEPAGIRRGKGHSDVWLTTKLRGMVASRRPILNTLMTYDGRATWVGLQADSDCDSAAS